jgi:beta-glucosidase
MKHKFKSILFGWVLITVFTACTQKQTYEYPFQNPQLSIDERVEDLLGRLTLEEKVAQMMNQTPAIERLGIPPYDWWNEALHGVARAGIATVFPQAIGLAATFDEQAVFETFDIISDEARAKYHNYQANKEYERYKGLTFWTPNINIFRDPRWGRGMETYGEDPYLTARMGVAAVKGLQGNDAKYFKSHACAKHYAVHSGPEWNRHKFDVTPSIRDLRETYLPAFESLVREANVREVMCAYNRVDHLPCCGSKPLLTDILRNEWKYKGIVVTDCGAINDFYAKGRHETHENASSASAHAVRSGTDLECGQSYNAIVEAVKTGVITEEELNVPLRRLFRGRFELGMFDNDKLVKWSKIPYSVVDSEKHKQKALDMAHKSMVLLKNGNQTLPLSKSVRKIAVVGPNANDSLMLWANYHGFPSSTKTILQGIIDKLPGVEIVYDKGCELVKEYVVEEFPNAVTFNGKPGFEAKYYDNINLEGNPIQTEMTQTIRYSTAGNTQFAANVPLNNFSATYIGDFKAPETCKITFSLSGDDGFRLYINEKIAFEAWRSHPEAPHVYEKEVKKGETYRLKIEYIQKGGKGNIDFSFGVKKNLDFEKTIEKVKDADAIIFAGGISPMLEGEEMSMEFPGFNRGDRTDIELPVVQKSFAEALKKTGKPLIFVLCSGSALSLNWFEENADAVLCAWYGGQAAGTAVADILWGDYNPAGRLPVTFYKSIDQLSGFEDYSMKGRTYRYMQQEPLYPFGYGLSYTSFKYNKVTLSKEKVKAGNPVNLNIDLQNTGTVNGDEVVQVYVKNNADKEGPVKSLRAFKRISIAAGKTAGVNIRLEPEAFATFYDDTQRMETRPGQYSIFAGSSSAEKDLVKLDLTLE